jgi:hypothetical protein
MSYARPKRWRLPGEHRIRMLMASKSRLVRAIPMTSVMVVVLIAFGLIVTAHWRKGAAALGVAALLAAILRLVLPENRIGPLAVRSRAFDVVLLLVLAVSLGLLSVGFYWF